MKKVQLFILFISYIIIMFLHIRLFIPPKNVHKLSTWYINGREYQLPTSIKITHPSTLVAVTYFYSKRSGKVYLVLPMITSHSFEVYVNGKQFFTEGYINGYVNVWTKIFQFPVDIIKGRNELKIVFHNLYTIAFRGVPYVSEKSLDRISALNLLIDLGSKASAGVAIILGIFLAFLTTKNPGKSYFLYFAHGFIFLGIYVFDSSFWEFYLPQAGFMLMKKVIYFTLANTIAFFIMGTDMVMYGRIMRKTRVLSYIGMSISFFVLLCPLSLNRVARIVHISTSPYILFLVFVFLVKIYFYGEKILTATSFLLLLGSIQHAISVILIDIPVPTVIGYSVIYMSISFTHYLVTEQKRIEVTLMKIRKELFVDPLTGAFNRRMFSDIGISPSDALIFFDIDDFKEVNDTHGHEYGDEVLKKFVKIAKRIVRKTDYIIRYGGDEFVVLLRGCDERKAKNIARKIANNFYEKTKAHLSFGISTNHVNIYDALKAADQNMYRIKKSKKGS